MSKVISMRPPIRLRGVLNVALIFGSLTAGIAHAQDAGIPPNAPGDRMGPPPMEGRRPPMERAFHLGPPGRWWNNPEFASELGLTPDQQKKMDAVFQENRPKLFDLFANVQKEEGILEPMLGADRLDDKRILAQVERVAQTRSELEKANGRMLLGLRRILTLDQWKKLQADDPVRHFHPDPRRDPIDRGAEPH